MLKDYKKKLKASCAIAALASIFLYPNPAPAQNFPSPSFLNLNTFGTVTIGCSQSPCGLTLDSPTLTLQENVTISGSTLSFSSPITINNGVILTNDGTINGGTISNSIGNTISIEPSGSGATLRTLQARARDIANALDYGADPTGTNDSSGKIANAIAAVVNGNSPEVFLPSGTYSLVANALTLNNCISLVGAGVGITTLEISGTFNTSDGGVLILENTSGCSQGITLRDFSMTAAQPSNFSTTAASTSTVGASTVTVTATGSVADNYLVYDTTDTASIPYGTTVQSMSGDTITLSGTLTAQVSSGDTILFAPSRNNSTTLAQGCSNAQGAPLCAYPPFVFNEGAFPQIQNVYMANAWKCINSAISPYNERFNIVGLKCGGVAYGLWADYATGLSSISDSWFAQWGFPGNLNAMRDYQTPGLLLGRIDGLSATNVQMFVNNITLDADAENAVDPYQFTNLIIDTGAITIDACGAGVQLTGLGLTGSTFPNTMLAVSSSAAECQVLVNNSRFANSSPSSLISIGAGQVKIAASHIENDAGNGAQLIQTGGVLTLLSNDIGTSIANSSPYVQVQSGSITAMGNTFATGTGTADNTIGMQITPDAAPNYIADNVWNGMTLIGPTTIASAGVLGIYVADGAEAIRTVTSSTDTMLVTDTTLLFDNSAGVGETVLPCGTNNPNARISFQDKYGNASSANDTLTPQSGDINGGSSYILAINNQAISFVCDGPAANWRINTETGIPNDPVLNDATFTGTSTLSSGAILINNGTISGGILSPGTISGLIAGSPTLTGTLNFLGSVSDAIIQGVNNSGSAGNGFLLQAGGAGAGTNEAGGSLVLSGGSSTGTGISSVIVQTTTAGSSGTAYNAPNFDAIIASGNTVTIPTVFVQSGSFNLGSGVLINNGSGTLELESSTLTDIASSTLDVTSSSVTLGSGSAIIDIPGTLSITGPLNNVGTISLANGDITDNGSGTIAIGSSGTTKINISYGTIYPNAFGGDFIAVASSATGTIEGLLQLESGAIIALPSGATVNSSGATMLQQSGTFSVTGGVVSITGGTTTLDNGGTLGGSWAGSPTFSGDVTISGTLNLSSGTLTVGSGSATALLGNTGNSTTPDQVPISSNLAFSSGTLGLASTISGLTSITAATLDASSILALSGATATGNWSASGTLTESSLLDVTGTLEVSNAATLSGGIVGITNGGTAASGIIGQFSSTSEAASAGPTLTTGTAASPINLVLTAGVYVVCGEGAFAMTSGTLTYEGVGLNTSVSLPALSAATPISVFAGISTTQGWDIPLTCGYENISNTETLYLVEQANFASGTVTVGGQMWDYRIR